MAINDAVKFRISRRRKRAPLASAPCEVYYNRNQLLLIAGRQGPGQEKRLPAAVSIPRATQIPVDTERDGVTRFERLLNALEIVGVRDWLLIEGNNYAPGREADVFGK